MLNTARRIALICILVFSFGLILISLCSLYLEKKVREGEIRESYLESQKTVTSREVERLVESIDKRRARLDERALDRAKTRINHAYRVAESLYAKYGKEMGSREVQALIVSALEGVRFDQGSGYYFVCTLDGQLLASAGRPDLQAKHYSEIESGEIRADFKVLIDLIQKDKEGVLEYQWFKPEQSETKTKKISYAKLFEPCNLILGTGVYLEEIEAELKNELLREIEQIRFGDNGYFFVDDYSGTILAHGLQQELVGTSIWDYEDSHGTFVFQELREAVKDPKGGFSHYWWRMPETGIERPKIAFAKVIPDWEWLIGTGLYVDEVELEIAQMNSNLRQQSVNQVMLILFVSGVLIVISYFSIGFWFRDLKKDVSFFEENLNLAAKNDILIDAEKIKSSELHNVAINVNQMIREKETVYRSTLLGMNHILQNFLNNMTLFKMYAEESADFPQETVEEIDQIIKETASRIREFDDIERINKLNIDKVTFKGIKPMK